MKIRILASGEVRHIENSTGTALVSAGLAVQTTDPLTTGGLPRWKPAPAPSPQWEVTVVGLERKELVIRMTLGAGVYQFSRNPADANATVSWDGGHRFLNGLGRAIPKDILELYRADWKSNPSLRGPEGGPSECPENVLRAADQATREAR